MHDSMDSRGPFDHWNLRVHHEADLWQICIHRRETTNHRIHHGETRTIPRRLVQIMEYWPPPLRLMQGVSWIDLHQPRPRLVNASDLRQVHTRNVLDICSRDRLRL